jgi:hypothetical protein
VEQIHDLRPGSYMFQVRGANNDGIWNEAGEGLALTMTPYYWQTIAFRVGVGVLLVSLGAAGAWGWSRSRIRRAAEREHAARELADAQQRMDLAAEAANVGMWMWD